MDVEELESDLSRPGGTGRCARTRRRQGPAATGTRFVHQLPAGSVRAARP